MIYFGVELTFMFVSIRQEKRGAGAVEEKERSWMYQTLS